MSEQVVCRPFEDGDLEGVLDLCLRVLNGGKRCREDLRRLRAWKFENNPYCSGDVPQGFVLEHKGRIVGHEGHLATPLKVGDTVTVAYTGHDFCVDQEFRGHGLKLARAFSRNAGAPVGYRVFLMATSANEASCRVLARYRFSQLDRGRVFWSRIEHSKGILRATVNEHRAVPWRLLNNEIALSAVSAPIDMFFRFRALLCRWRERLRTERVERFGDEFDDLWREISPHYGVLVVRDSEYLNWRYLKYPLQSPEAFAAYGPGGGIRGFVAVGMAVTVPDKPRTAVIMELFTKPDDVVAQQELVLAALRYANARRADRIRAGFFPPKVGGLLRRNRFFRRRKRYSAYLYKASGPLPDQVLCDEANWFMSLGDGDASF